MIREIFKISTDSITIKIPAELRNREVELLILPFDRVDKKVEITPKKLFLTTYKCGALLRNFTREDAYFESI